MKLSSQWGTLFVSVLLVLGSSFRTSAQQKNLQLLLSDFKSADINRRADAYENIKDDQDILRRPEVEKALVDLLDLENNAFRRGIQGGEGYTEYVSELQSTVGSIADWHDRHQACVLAESSHAPGTAFARIVVAKGGRTIVPCLLTMSRGDRNARFGSIPMLAQILPENEDLTLVERTQIRKTVIAGLQDTEPGVRHVTVDALAKYGTADFIPILKDIAQSDPHLESANESASRRYDIRDAAAQALKSIQERAKPK